MNAADRLFDGGSILFVGLGNMGSPMAGRVAESYRVLVHDADSEVTARVAAALAAEPVAELSALPNGITCAVLMLPNSRIVELVLLGADGSGEQGLFAALPSGTAVIDMSSSEPESTQRLHALAAARGIRYIDAPVSGGVIRAETGELSVMVGADDADFEHARPVLERMGGAIIHVGGPGSGHAAKAINNVLSASNLVSAAEALLTANRFGIESAKMLEVINSSTARSQASELKFPKHILSEKYDSGFYFSLMVKDITIATSLMQKYGLVVPNLMAAKQSAEDALRLLGDTSVTGGPLDHTELARYVQVINRADQ
ncbi:MAG: NAD(P)-dependent oxidoreductase [Microterricola sp.]